MEEADGVLLELDLLGALAEDVEELRPLLRRPAAQGVDDRVGELSCKSQKIGGMRKNIATYSFAEEAITDFPQKRTWAGVVHTNSLDLMHTLR